MKQDSMYGGLDSLGRTGNRPAKPPPEEPDAGNPHVRVCEGPGRQRPGLLGNNNRTRGSSRKEKEMNAIIKTLLVTVLVALGLPMTAWAAESPKATAPSELDKLVGQPADLSLWAYAWRADRQVQEKPEAYFIPRRLARLDTIYRPYVGKPKGDYAWRGSELGINVTVQKECKGWPAWTK
jgi:hypothetical protein